MELLAIAVLALLVGGCLGYCVARAWCDHEAAINLKPLVMKRRCPGCGDDVASWRTFADGSIRCCDCDGPRAA